jgi:hypothetical protein
MVENVSPNINQKDGKLKQKFFSLDLNRLHRSFISTDCVTMGILRVATKNSFSV